MCHTVLITKKQIDEDKDEYMRNLQFTNKNNTKLSSKGDIFEFHYFLICFWYGI